MENDLVKRLRDGEPCYGNKCPMMNANSGCQCAEAADRIELLEVALREIDKATISHVDGRDLLDELHPRNMLDIRRRIDGVETWFEGDWLSNLRDARNLARDILESKS